MVNLGELYVGQKIKIVDRWIPGEYLMNNEGKMDKYLGTVVTISDVCDDFVRIHEDSLDVRKWNWYPSMLEYYYGEDESDFEPQTEEALKLLFRNQY